MMISALYNQFERQNDLLSQLVAVVAGLPQMLAEVDQLVQKIGDQKYFSFF